MSLGSIGKQTVDALKALANAKLKQNAISEISQERRSLSRCCHYSRIMGRRRVDGIKEERTGGGREKLREDGRESQEKDAWMEGK